MLYGEGAGATYKEKKGLSIGANLGPYTYSAGPVLTRIHAGQSCGVDAALYVRKRENDPES